MRTLYHWPLDPASRQARIALGEKKLKFRLEPVNPWDIPESILNISPEGMPPIMIEATSDGNVVISGPRAICEYVQDSTPRHPIIGETPQARAEARRICSWFDQKFADEVNAYIMHEKVEKILTGGGNPDTATLRIGVTIWPFIWTISAGCLSGAAGSRDMIFRWQILRQARIYPALIF